MKHLNLPYVHCDVFTEIPLSGNSLTVFFMDKHPKYYSDRLLLSITREMRHFESVFVNVPYELIEYNNSLENVDGKIPTIIIPTRVFTCNSELDFAGHPLQGAAASIHNKCLSNFSKTQVQFELNHKRLTTVNVSKSGYGYLTTMFQGKPEFLKVINNVMQQQELLTSLNLLFEDYDNKYPIEVISTGLKYLIIPVKSHEILSKTKIMNIKFAQLLAKHNADFVYVVDLKTKTARTWENDGSSEDAATGSAAGPLGAYLIKHDISKTDEIFDINQGEFIGRPCKLTMQVAKNFENILVSGGVCIVGDGRIKIKF